MSNEFEKAKNRNASALTLGITGLLLLIFFMLKWPLPSGATTYGEEYIEMDLGDSETGSNMEEDQRPGDPAPAQAETYTTPQPTPAVATESRDIQTDDDQPDDVPVVRKPQRPNPRATEIKPETPAVRTTNNPQPAVVQAPPRPRAVMGRTMGGSGNGGNGADTYKPGGGDGTGGSGNAGSPGGNPDGRGTGTPRNLGVQVVNMPAQTFEDEFNENGKIALDVLVDGNGRLVSAAYNINGSTLPKSSPQYAIAMRRVHDLAWPKMEGGFRQKKVFNFRVN